MPRSFKPRAFAGVMLVGAIAFGSAGAASASAPLPGISPSHFTCSNGKCAIGPGNTGMPFASGLDGTGGPAYTGPESNPYQMSVVSGSLPPGLKLALPDTEWMIMGTPTKPGTYTFTVHIVALAGGPDGYQQFSITIGTGSSDNLQISGAAYLSKFQYLQVSGFDVNVSATYTVYATSTGAKLGTLGEVNSGDGLPFNGDGGLIANIHLSPLSVPQHITVKDTLGGSVTVPVTIVKPY
jgi:hypothetical protein